jgi:sorting and assembly machinery component 37
VRIERLILKYLSSFSSFVESHGQPLLDLSLYVSSQNYAITRPIYSTLQSFPLPYLTPTSIRTAAKHRTAHLGLSSLDIDSEDGEPTPATQSLIPESLRRPKNTVSSLLAASPETNASIRLDALATNFFEPLDKLKGKKQFFVSNSQFSSLDCLLLGYLSLALLPELPQPWLSKTMRVKFPSLCTWTEKLSQEIFGPEVKLHDAFLSGEDLDIRLKRLRGRGHLPWKAPENTNPVATGVRFVSAVADGIPVVGQLRRNTRMREHGGKTPEDDAQSSSWQSIAAVGSLILGVGAVVGYMFQQGIIGEGEEERQGGLGAFGEAGEALGVYARQMDSEVQRQRAAERNFTQGHGEPVVEVDVEVERGGGVVVS